MLRTKFILCSLLITPTLSFAYLPLTIEDLLTKKNELRLDLGVNYANSYSTKTNAHFDLVQTGTGNFVLLPVHVSENQQNNDIFAFTLGVRYGIGRKTELYTRTTATASDVRSTNGIESENHSSQNWNEMVVGVNHQFSQDNNTPALLGFAEISTVENTAADGANFIFAKTGQVGFTIYRTIDPVVLSLTTGYRYAVSRVVNNHKIDPGDLFFINPSLGFAINNEVTVMGGVQFKVRGKDEVDGSGMGMYTSQSDIDFGLGYSASKNMTLNFNIRADISGDSGAQAGFNLLYKR